MSDPQRRSDDTWRSRMEDRLDKAIGELREHVGGCSQLQKNAEEWRERADVRFDKFDAKLDQILMARAGEAGEKRGAIWMVRGLWALAGGIGVALVWFKDHITLKSLALAVLLIAGSALAHDDDTARGRYLGSLVSPKTGASCCNLQDCSETDDWRGSATGYEVKVEGQWIPVPNDVIVRDRPSPDGRAVLCYRPVLGILCFVEGQGV